MTGSDAIELLTPRLRLRSWRDADREPFAALSADPVVMQFYPSVSTRETSDASIDHWQSHLQTMGWSNFAIERRDTGAFIGYVGLSIPRRVLPFTPCVEIGWRLARDQWRQGFASEAAERCLELGFSEFDFDEIVSFTTLLNQPSRAVMRRIGMVDVDRNFEHPALAEGHPLRMHCLYKITREQWSARRER